MSTYEQAELANHPVSAPAMRRYHAWAPAKRVFDLCAASLLMVLTMPATVFAAVLVAITSRGPIFFGQPRVGRKGRVFRCWKFRTMHVDAEMRLHADDSLYERYVANDFKLEAHEDPRLTSVGHFLRRTSLDELPQLFNVLAGTMSLVGPRPVVVDELDSYGPWKDTYLAAKPGVTGPWQCSGRNEIRYPERAELDADYLENWSPLADAKILVRTIPAVLRRNGVS